MSYTKDLEATLNRLPCLSRITLTDHLRLEAIAMPEHLSHRAWLQMLQERSFGSTVVRILGLLNHFRRISHIQISGRMHLLDLDSAPPLLLAYMRNFHLDSPSLALLRKVITGNLECLRLQNSTVVHSDVEFFVRTHQLLREVALQNVSIMATIWSQFEVLVCGSNVTLLCS
ncbi:uncharacterized protein B0I36DRAFT_320682 [Microdochium trichocladiopsis]|uniref:Uncharacterized protein n=1 Tax=Microdochium trichocladiopsis TaxID=1682393 RepID=A0A9P8YB18_9PEZI|nr:uncharacterized protein B0I36DRAFT_320682 [Microdochium trichocladiopsis]KAH7033059.1 hypothetical protein B0I36DRAFT_320682 [Microdochium trichocladiopsis]